MNLRELKREIKYIKETKDIWFWLMNNPMKGKLDYPYFEKINKYLNSCPCCSLYRKETNNNGVLTKNCTSCPLNVNKNKQVPCHNAGFFNIEYHCHPSFYKWCYAKKKQTSQKHATIIFNILDKAYKEKSFLLSKVDLIKKKMSNSKI